jgi:hypothetical protein
MIGSFSAYESFLEEGCHLNALVSAAEAHIETLIFGGFE